MLSPQQTLQLAVDAALTGMVPEGFATDSLRVVPATNPQFGDYQFNGALPLAKALGQKPRDIATALLEKLEVGHVSEPPQLAGPGFINFKLTRAYLEASAIVALLDPRQGVPPVQGSVQRTIVVDYPSPNVAKPLHVGHIRPTFIGDAVVRLLRFVGHKVITDNHIGDWGTPIGKVIVGWKKYRDEPAFAAAPLDEMGRLYKIVNLEGETDPAVLSQARLETAKLQQGDPENLTIWKQLRDASQVELDALYARLGVVTDHTLGESFYNDMLEGVLADLEAQGIAEVSQGALIVQFEEPEQLRDKPMLVRKSDGSALYATTDLATLRYRMQTWNPDEIIYVVDVRQSDHFRQLFATAKKWGYTAQLQHVSFGTILGENGKPISTREGVTSKLTTLLEEAERRARETAAGINADLTPADLAEIGRVLGLAALKYADLSPNRTSDYKFSWDKMLALNGNSAVYLEYAYVRTRSLKRMAAARGFDWPQAPTFRLENASEQILARTCLQFGEVIDQTLEDYRPHLLCDYLYQLAGTYSAFWRDCRVLDADVEPGLRESRMGLAQLTGDILKRGLTLLGLETVESM